MNTKTQTLGSATVAWENAARALYVAERRGGRGIGLAKARERKAWENLRAARG